jgi:hypothetical protein
MCYCDFDPPEVYDYYFRKAVKRHCCYECGGRIEPGEKYVIHKGYWDGWHEYKWCMECYHLSLELSQLDCHCYAFGDLGQAIAEAEVHDLLTLFLANKQERGADVSGWIAAWAETEHPDLMIYAE